MTRTVEIDELTYTTQEALNEALKVTCDIQTSTDTITGGMRRLTPDTASEADAAYAIADAVEAIEIAAQSIACYLRGIATLTGGIWAAGAGCAEIRHAQAAKRRIEPLAPMDCDDLLDQVRQWEKEWQNGGAEKPTHGGEERPVR